MKTTTSVDALLAATSATLPTWTERPYPFCARERDREKAVLAAEGWRDMNKARARLKVTTWDGILCQRFFEALAEDDPQVRADLLVQLAAASLAAAATSVD